jgi:DNA-binding IscR family transcriptional regulator
MRSHKLSDALHILAYIEIFGTAGTKPQIAANIEASGIDLSSTSIAQSVESNPGVVRRLMAALSKAGLLETRPGSAEPRLARAATDISVLDVYRAIDGEERLLHIDPKTNPECPVGGAIQGVLNDVYAKVQADAEASMASASLDSIVKGIQEHR